MDPNPLRVAIYDKSPVQRSYLRSALSGNGIQPICFESFPIMLENITALAPAGAIIGAEDINRIPIYVDAVKDAKPDLPVMAIRRGNQSDKPQGAQLANGVSWISLDDELEDFVHTIQRSLKGNRGGTDIHMPSSALIGSSPEIQRIKAQVQKLKGIRDSVLISGEKGCGKEQLARFIHAATSDAEASFVKICCSDLDTDLFERQVLPLLNSANPLKLKHIGTILLDKIDALTHDLQTLLMGQFTTGKGLAAEGESGIEMGWRVIATTQVDMDDRVNEARFRGDLYYRLSVIKFCLPPLRQRTGDIPILTEFYLYHFCRRWGRAFMNISPELKQLMADYAWPGNLDELIDVIATMVESQSTAPLTSQPWFRKQMELIRSGRQPIASTVQPIMRDSFDKQIESTQTLPLKAVSDQYVAKIEKRILEHVLAATHWNRKKAAALMDISYKSVLNKIRDYGLT